MISELGRKWMAIVDSPQSHYWGTNIAKPLPAQQAPAAPSALAPNVGQPDSLLDGAATGAATGAVVGGPIGAGVGAAAGFLIDLFS